MSKANDIRRRAERQTSVIIVVFLAVVTWVVVKLVL